MIKRDFIILPLKCNTIRSSSLSKVDDKGVFGERKFRKEEREMERGEE